MKRRWLPLAIVWIAAAAVAASAWPAAAASAAGANASARPADLDLVTINFVNADIEGVVKAISKITGKNFVLDPRVKGTVNIVSAKPISAALVYEVFLAALRVHGYAAVEEHGIVKIIPATDARVYPSPTRGPNDKPRDTGDQIQTQVFALQHESAVQLVPILRPLITPTNTIAANSGSNSLVITDYAGNLRRIEKIISAIDQPSGAEPAVIPLRHASALDVAQIVHRLFTEAPRTAGAAADSSRHLTVVADARSNSLIVRSGDPSRLFRLRSLVATLDSPTSVAGNLHVVHLRNAEASKIAETLRGIYLGDAAPAAPRAPTALGPSPVNAPAGASRMTTPLTSSAPAQTATGPLGIIQADVATNSIIINAPDAIYNNLRAALDKLDVRRAQVYVEALIAEVTADKASEFGIQWQSLSGAGGTDGSARAFGGTNFGAVAAGQNILGVAAAPATAGRGLNVGVIKGRVTLPNGTEILNLALLVRALETDSNANILSTPTLLTLDNEEARIIIGQNVPFITGSYAVTGAATTPTPFQTIERKDVGLTLRVRPQISEGGTVRLQIYQEVSSVVDTLLANPAGPTTNKRAVESTVLVDDGQIVVIGGLIQDSVKDGIEKVPLLGDLPLVGSLFQYKTRARSKTNLMVFLRPTVVRDAAGADPLTSERYDYILGEQRKIKPTPSAVFPDVNSPSLPPRQSPAPTVPPAAPPAPSPPSPLTIDDSPFPESSD